MAKPAQIRSGRKFDSTEQEVFLNLWRTYDSLKMLEERVFSEFDLSAQQYNALRLLQTAHPGKLPTLAIGRRLISRAPDITRMLDRLENRQLIVRERRPENRRVVEVAITSAGLGLLEQMQSAVSQMHADQLGHLSAIQQQELIALLHAARQPHELHRNDWDDLVDEA
jgi:DNA-binding MarR family transcriptional regulator